MISLEPMYLWWGLGSGFHCAGAADQEDTEYTFGAVVTGFLRAYFVQVFSTIEIRWGARSHDCS